MTTGDPEPISDEARQAIEQELDGLRTERGRVAESLAGVGGDTAGDHADRADELERAERLAHLDTRIRDLTVRLHQADLAGPARTDQVGVGSSVALRFADGSEQTLQVGEVAEALDPTLVTVDSPLGGALLGRRTGDSVHYDTPAGPTTAVIVSIGGRAKGS
ncbi:GreA/GreB family elongation factor [Streptomyces cavernicola]|uniref:GreA/GreB family elongation factor n=1 Tax=Streptomyces cavernicola TaxID=3043613 RepID=A0ABT6SFP7_9ACTN|nr:GreA/GreB family elongation factor [Streptomyces sp. B-S-A6]MDI3407026.1 GreA/GreB family elongation factor [Streptomyces sp. B-S-A6]